MSKISKVSKKVEEFDRRVECTRLSLALIGVAVTSMTAEICLRTIEVMQKKGEKFALSDSVSIRHIVDEKYKAKDEEAPKLKSVSVEGREIPLDELEKIDLPIISVGGRKLKMTPDQEWRLRRVIALFGQKSIEAKAEMFAISQETRTVKVISITLEQC